MDDNSLKILKEKVLEETEIDDAFNAAVYCGELKNGGSISCDEEHYYHGLALVANLCHYS